MDLKYNINKIHSDLISQFYKSEIKIEEKSDNRFGNHFEISVINEDRECKMIFSKREIENSKFNWIYFSDPLDENSNIVERTSSIENFVNDVVDIFEKRRFDAGYLNKINEKANIDSLEVGQKVKYKRNDGGTDEKPIIRIDKENNKIFFKALNDKEFSKGIEDIIIEDKPTDNDKSSNISPKLPKGNNMRSES